MTTEVLRRMRTSTILDLLARTRVLPAYRYPVLYVMPLRRHCGRHAFTRFSTTPAQVGALLQHLIFLCYLVAVFPAEFARLSTHATHSIVKQ